MLKGKRFAAICADGVVRSAVVTASEAWAWDAIRASVQVSKDGQRFSISGNLSAVGVGETFLYRHAAPPGVAYRFHSATLAAVCGCTPHRPVAPRLRKLAAAFVAPWATRPRFFLYALAEIIRAEAAARGLVSPEILIPGERGPRPWAKPIRAALARVKPEPLARMARLAWAVRCFKLDEAARDMGATEGRAWKGRRI